MFESQQSSRKIRVIKGASTAVNIAFVVELGIAAENILPGYSADIFGISAQTMLNASICRFVARRLERSSSDSVRSIGARLRRHNPTLSIATSLASNTLWEFGQAEHVFGGRFDPKDFAAYVAGTLLYLGAHTAASRFRRRG